MDGLTQTQHEIVRTFNSLRNFLLIKNLRYGDSALNPIRIFSKLNNIEQIKIRIDDKLNRLLKGGELSDETLEQTIIDLIGYCVLLLIAIGYQKRKHTFEGLNNYVALNILNVEEFETILRAGTVEVVTDKHLGDYIQAIKDPKEKYIKMLGLIEKQGEPK